MNQIKQPEISIYSGVSLSKYLIDTRPNSYGISFGTVADVCKQYGIKCKKLENCIEFTAPKLRLQMFLEKLHFSRISYCHNPF